jgi:hypothetical protein
MKILDVTSWHRPGWIADNLNPFETLDEFRNRSAEYNRKWDEKIPTDQIRGSLQ